MTGADLSVGDLLAAAAIIETRANQTGVTHLRALADRLTAALPDPTDNDQEGGNDGQRPRPHPRVDLG